MIPRHLVDPEGLDFPTHPQNAICGAITRRGLALHSDDATCKVCILAHALYKIRMSLSPQQAGYAQIIDTALARVRESRGETNESQI